MRLLLAAYACYLAVLVYLVWTPAPAPLTDGGVVQRVTELLNGLGLSVNDVFSERALNVLLFVPLSLLGSFVWSRLTVRHWVLIGFIATCVIEAGQREFLPTRASSSSDIIMNTLGALLGACAGWLARRQLAVGIQSSNGGAANSAD